MIEHRSRGPINPAGKRLVLQLGDNTPAFGVVERSIRATVPAERLIVTPYLVPGATDSRYFTGLSDNGFRFLPIMVSREDIETIHGSNERIDAANVSICAAFVYELIRNADAL